MSIDYNDNNPVYSFDGNIYKKIDDLVLAYKVSVEKSNQGNVVGYKISSRSALDHIYLISARFMLHTNGIRPYYVVGLVASGNLILSDAEKKDILNEKIPETVSKIWERDNMLGEVYGK